MPVVKSPRFKNLTVGCDDIPFIGLMITTGITMLDGHVERVSAYPAATRLDTSDIRLSR
jgi:hypothetical protein